MKAYICSPFRAEKAAILDRNIEYAQAITRYAIKKGYAPITPHLYMTQCLDERNEQEREAGLAAGLELLEVCDIVIVGILYGISEGMLRELRRAAELGIDVEVATADKLIQQHKKK
jgi:chloramphenicol 3-O-phosphotransferase